MVRQFYNTQINQSTNPSHPHITTLSLPDWGRAEAVDTPLYMAKQYRATGAPPTAAVHSGVKEAPPLRERKMTPLEAEAYTTLGVVVRGVAERRRGVRGCVLAEDDAVGGRGVHHTRGGSEGGGREKEGC